MPYERDYPRLPMAIFFNALAVTNDYFYSCGGEYKHGTENKCNRLSRNDPDAVWEHKYTLPRRTPSLTAANIGDHNVWLVDSDRIYNLDERTEELTTTKLPFWVNDNVHCTVSNGNYTYIIGAGSNSIEIWTNTNPRDETSWHKVANIKEKRKYLACLWYDSNIMITGGFHNIPTVEIFNTETNAVTESTPLLKGRAYHEMMLHDGYPTVFGGGHGLERLSGSESFDISSGEWFVADIELQEGKYMTAFQELEPHLGVRGDGQC